MRRKINNILLKYFWRLTYDHPALKKECHYTTKPFENLHPEFDDIALNSSFKNDNTQWFHHEYVYCIEGLSLVEPAHRIIIKHRKTIIAESLPVSCVRPSLFSYLRFKWSTKKTQHFEKAIIFDNSLGQNYFHFFSDVLSKLWLIEKYNIDKNVPLIIPEELYNKAYFRYLYQFTDIGKFNWYVQGRNEFLIIKSLYLLRPFPYEPAYWKKSVALLRNHNPRPERKIFLNRAPSAGRFLNNMKDVLPVLEKYGFELVDTATLSFREQVDLFSQAAIVIGIHGAGNTNIIFAAHDKVKLIEIMPANRPACQYYWLTQSLDISYDVIAGSTLDEKQSFSIDTSKLENTIQKHLNS